MTLEQAKQCYRAAGGQFDHSRDEWADIHEEMERVVAAKSDRAAGKIIRWWGCWGRRKTTMQFVRAIRAEYAKIARAK